MRYGGFCDGVGGLSLSVESAFADVEPSWFCEYEEGPSRVLAHHWPNVPNLGDLTALELGNVPPVDLICAGFPCQDISYAGKGAGLDGERSGLWWPISDAIGVLRPQWVVIENVDAIRTRGLAAVTYRLAELGYVGAWGSFSSADIGAPHGRPRVFIVAKLPDATSPRLQGTPKRQDPATSRKGLSTDCVAPPTDADLERRLIGTGLSEIREKGERRPGPSNRDRASVADTDRELSERRGGSVKFRRAMAQECDRRLADQGGAAARSGSADASDSDDVRLEALPMARIRGRERQYDSDGCCDRGSKCGHWIASLPSGKRVDYGPSVRRWERITATRAPWPVLVDGRLRPELPEWMLGYDGWITDPAIGLTSRQAKAAAGNSVQPQVGALAISSLKRRIDLKHD